MSDKTPTENDELSSQSDVPPEDSGRSLSTRLKDWKIRLVFYGKRVAIVSVVAAVAIMALFVYLDRSPERVVVVEIAASESKLPEATPVELGMAPLPPFEDPAKQVQQMTESLVPEVAKGPESTVAPPQSPAIPMANSSVTKAGKPIARGDAPNSLAESKDSIRTAKKKDVSPVAKAKVRPRELPLKTVASVEYGKNGQVVARREPPKQARVRVLPGGQLPKGINRKQVLAAVKAKWEDNKTCFVSGEKTERREMTAVVKVDRSGKVLSLQLRDSKAKSRKTASIDKSLRKSAACLKKSLGVRVPILKTKSKNPQVASFHLDVE